MILVDTALKARAAEGRPIRVGMIGAGFMGRGVALQIASAVPGMRLVAIACRTVTEARRAYLEAGAGVVREVGTPAALDAAIAAGEPAITDDWRLLCDAGDIAVILEVTGAIEYAAQTVKIGRAQVWPPVTNDL